MVRLILSLLFTLTPAQALFAQTVAVESTTKAESSFISPLEKLTLEQKVGQLMIIGFSGKDFDPRLKKTLGLLNPGSVILFKHNLKTLNQVATLNQNLQTYSIAKFGVPLFIMIDQEGGPVARIRTTPPLPSALAMGNTKDSVLIESLGLHIGQLLKLLGFNMNLAPVLDLGDPLRPNFIGNRSFGGDAHHTSEMAFAFSTGLVSASVVPTAKHFPGHGGLNQDSHKKTPSKLLTLEELEATDLVPFKAFAGLKGASAVMAAHVAFPNIDDSGLPAAFSSVMIDEILRGKLNYQGLVITDDLEMLGADRAGSIEERAIKAIEAGCDMVMVAWSPRRQQRVYNGLLKAVRSGRISLERLNQSVSRILNAKASLPVPATREKPVFRHQLQTKLADLRTVTKEVAKANFKQGSASFTREKIDRVPASQPLVLLSSDPRFYTEFLLSRPKNDVKFMRLTPKTLTNTGPYLRKHPDALAIYFATGSITAKALSGLTKETKSRMIVINGSYPGAIESHEQFKMVIDLNTPEPESARWLAEQFFEGTLRPIDDLPADIREPASDFDPNG